jgi:hypothetical protein
MTGSLSWFGAAHLRARALAASSALLGGLMVAATSAPAVAQLMGHFGISWSEAAQIIGLVAAGSLILFWLFPWLIPVLGTIRLILIFVGTGAAIGW